MSRVRDLASILTASSNMATDTELSAVSAQIPAYVAGKNFIINGGFDFWQRGISISSLSGSPQTYTADRWWYSNTPNITGTVSRQPTGDTTNLPSIQYCARVQRTAGNTGVNPLYFCQEIETVNSIPLAGKTVTISFYARKGTNYSQNNSQLLFQLRSGTGVDQNCYSGFTNSTNIIQNQASLLTTVWQRFSYSIPVPSTSTQLGAFFYYGASGTAGVSDYFEITGIQLEVGSVATEFSRAGGDIQGELAKCQRYYHKAVSESLYGSIGTGKAYSSNILNINVPLPVKMRSIPSVTSGDLSALSTFQFETGATAGTTPTSIATNPNLNSSTYGSVDVTKTSAFTTGAFYYLMGSNNSNSFIGFNAEL
jgi:hypothetical protein